MIRKLKNEQEKKFIETVIDGEVAANGGAGTVLLLNGIAQGDTNVTCEGNRITLESLAMKFTLRSAGAETGFAVRVIIAVDRKPNGTAMTWTGAGTGLCSSADINSTYLKVGQSRGKFQVLSDKVYQFQGLNRVKNVKYFFNLKGTKQVLDLGTAGTIADINANSIYILVNTIYNAAIVHYDGHASIRFTDA